jgi:hypothetical protein
MTLAPLPALGATLCDGAGACSFRRGKVSHIAECPISIEASILAPNSTSGASVLLANTREFIFCNL